MVGISRHPLRVEVIAGLEPVLVRVHGELDLDTAPALRAALAPLLHRRVELDLTEVEFIDSSGLNVLLSHHRQCELAGGHATVINASRVVQRVFRVTGVAQFLAGSEELGGPPRSEHNGPSETP
ncbi:STAS domain-containing protein [Streptomyces violascens]|uniref:STAS domain-containing protein n=1 Tax=Streptomyces violascens TaxID=67381 RepID=UPI003658C531